MSAAAALVRSGSGRERRMKRGFDLAGSLVLTRAFFDLGDSLVLVMMPSWDTASFVTFMVPWPEEARDMVTTSRPW